MEILEKIFDDCDLKITGYERVHGGDINNAYCLSSTSGKYFLKVNDEAKFPHMFSNEANGLDLLRNNSSLIVPTVIKTGICYKEQYILLEWLEKGPVQKNTWRNFGADLAMMHKKHQAYFGLDGENYIGSLFQDNTKHSQWSTFYTECRILPLAKKLFDMAAFSAKDIDNANAFCKKLDDLFPKESPALLHGDLWAGNFLITSIGRAAIYDPAVYFGHREMDIGMTKLFGGFDQHFYDVYNDTYPLAKGWEKRLPVTQIYPLFVHAVLFGGHYIGAVKEILKAFS